MDRKKKFFVWKIMLTVISFSSLIMIRSTFDFSDLRNNYIDAVLLREIIYDLSVGVFSAMVLVWFLDAISERIKDTLSKEREKHAIRRTDKSLRHYIRRYVILFNCVSSPLERRNSDSSEMTKNFSLSDMRDMHETSLLLNERLLGSSIESFLEIELEVRNQFTSILRNIDFEYHPVFSEIFLEFVEVSLEYECRNHLLEIDRDPNRKKMMKNFLENHADDYYRHPAPGNAMYPYALLYEMMQKERETLKKYKHEIANL